MKERNCIPPHSPYTILHHYKVVARLLGKLRSRQLHHSQQNILKPWFQFRVSYKIKLFSGCYCSVKPSHFVFNSLNSWCKNFFHLYVKQTIWWYYKGSELFPTTRQAKIYHFLKKSVFSWNVSSVGSGSPHRRQDKCLRRHSCPKQRCFLTYLFFIYFVDKR